MRARHRFIGYGLVVALCAAAAPPPAYAADCSLQSPPHRVAVLELYTSEGCSSCPPLDRWLSSLPQRGITSDSAVLLAFHVDYWNQLGWPDRFSQPGFTQRQHAIAARSRSGVVYTPELVLDGRDLRAGTRPEDLDARLRSINAEKPGATIRAEIAREPAMLRVTAEILDARSRADAEVWLAIFESGLSSRVTAGENAGRALYHDFVVREFAGPFPVGNDGQAHIDHRMHQAADWNQQRTGLAILIQRRNNGEVVQAAALSRLCGS
jgi:hypothetical protein